jgi:nucleotide-binding universal stress UspA family protein
MKKILCPTDFSEAAHNAIAYAAKFAQASGATMTLFNVQSLFSLSPVELVRGKAFTIESVSQQLEDQSREVSRVFRISCDARVQPSTSVLSKVIEQKAEEYDLLIMGTAGPDDFYKFFAGSNTYNTITRSNIPAILVPENCVYSPIEKVVYAYNYLVERKLPMTQLVPWIKKLKPQLTILEVMEEAHSIDADDDLKDVQQLLRLLYSEIQFGFDTLHSGHVAKSIHEYMVMNTTDMLVLCSKHRNFIAEMFHNSVLKSISSIATYPVFILHA